MTGREAFEIWAPRGAKWTEWARPVPFVAIEHNNTINIHPSAFSAKFTVPKTFYIKELQNNTAIILDLPGYDGIREGLALAVSGWRPIPLYNGTNGQPGSIALVDNKDIEHALIWGAGELEKIVLSNNAPPVFLLDSKRTHRHKMNPSIFDNSWDLYPQDIPTAEYFFKNGINNIIIHSDIIRKDLIKIFYKFQSKGIQFSFTNGYEDPREVLLPKPPRKYRN